MDSIGKKIRKLRTSKNMSQERFGRKIGISGKSISAYENDICVPSLKVMEAISSIYGKPVISTPNRDEIVNTINLVKSNLKMLEDILTDSLSL